MSPEVFHGFLARHQLFVPCLIEADIFLHERIEAFAVHGVDDAEVDAQESPHLFGVLVGELAVGQQKNRLADAAVRGAGGNLITLLSRRVGGGSPYGNGVSESLGIHVHSRAGQDVLDFHVLVLEPEDVQPGAEQIVRGGFFRAQDELAAHGVRTAVDIGITGIGSLGLQDRAVGADIDGVEIGFVVADADDVELPLGGGHERRDGSASGDFPLVVALPGNDFVAGAEAEHTDIKARVLVPSFLFGIPDEERLMLADPGRLQLLGGFCVRREQTQDESQKAHQNTESHRSPLPGREGSRPIGMLSGRDVAAVTSIEWVRGTVKTCAAKKVCRAAVWKKAGAQAPPPFRLSEECL